LLGGKRRGYPRIIRTLRARMQSMKQCASASEALAFVDASHDA
jgi:hypothetical protein